uniref:Putative invasion-inducing protein n=1 Tax=Culex tarsalis TaxID=7177 RepID=A0A1Q3F2U6_CULTA
MRLKSALTSDDLELSAIFASNSPLQLRAVSSPSLTEPTPPVATTTTTATTVVQQQQHVSAMTKDGRLAVTQQQQLSNKAVVLAKTGGHHNPQQQVSESVLQKFKKTFAQFKPTTKAAASPHPQLASHHPVGPGSHSFDGSTTFLPHQQQHHPAQQQLVTTMSVDSATSDGKGQQLTTHHRFGPLIWRSSKERRKTKSHRRDKCNSGDSGIQVELEPDELHEGLDTAEPTVSNLAASVSVRRANSAKVSSGVGAGTTLLKHKLSLKSSNKENVASNVSRLSGKSLSQPSGLDSIAAAAAASGGELRRSATDLTDSDSDDHHEHHHHHLPHHLHHPDHRLRPPNDGDDEEPVFAEVLFSFRPAGPQELALEKGALVEVLKRESGPWWWGRIKSDAILADDDREDEIDTSDCGWFPMDFVKVVPTFNKPKQIIIINNNNGTRNGEDVKIDVDLKNCDSLDDPSGTGTTMMTEEGEGEGPTDAAATSQDRQTKENVIKELLETEINYVKLLNSLCLGYIKPLREREDVFPADSVNIVFSNLEKIWRFQQTFLDALRIAVPNNRIGEVFLEYQSAFMIYSSYCNSYPRALMELENYTHNKEACTILENCRVAQNLPELPLSAHLLAPIQRICRYPLHLSELVKHSPTRKELLPQLNLRKCTKSELETLDCRETFELALTAMRRVTEMVNEGKRHSEYLSRIQSRFENFQGPSINVHSTRLFLQTDAIRMSPNLWNNTYTLFLFDRQLVYCKKDLLKRTNYIYKGRIFLDNCRILNLPDGKMFGVTLKNALRLYCDTRNKWFDFCFRSSSSKLRFLNTLSAERQFCGESLFVSELDGAACVDEDNLSDREYFPFGEDKDGCSNTDTETSNGAELTDSMQFLLGNMSASARSSSNCSTSGVLKESPTNVKATTAAAGNTLPKKSRKLTKEQQQQQQQLAQQQQSSEYSSHSLGRRKLGNWFRKAKSTNSTPSQSPTHHPMALSLAAVNAAAASDSSSASSPGLGYQQRTLSALSTNGAAVPAVTKGKPKEPPTTNSTTLMTQSATS